MGDRVIGAWRRAPILTANGGRQRHLRPKPAGHFAARPCRSVTGLASSAFDLFGKLGKVRQLCVVLIGRIGPFPPACPFEGGAFFEGRSTGGGGSNSIAVFWSFSPM